MRRFSLFVITVLFFNLSIAQNRAQGGKGRPNLPKIVAKVVNESNEAVPFANVALYTSSDSTLLMGTATDQNGDFEIVARPGDYYLKVSFLSFKTTIKGQLKLGREGLSLGPIMLQSNAELLDEVEVTAERSQMELKLDKRVFNIQKDLANAGANAAEILDNIPSVQVDVEGNISLRGSENVRVLIDGKPSTITGSSTADVLRQFQGSMIEKVEVITNPSARYDAEGEVGIINIVLKKEKQKGINGGVEVVAGYPDNYRTSFNLNYRTQKVNLFTSYGISYRDSPGQGDNFQTFNSPDTSYIYESESKRQRASLSNNVRLGTDYYINSKNTLTLSGFYSYSDEENTAELEYRDLFSNRELFRLVTRDDVEDEQGERVETSLNYEKTFDKEDQKFTIDLQWSESDDLERSDIVETNFLDGTQIFQKSRNVEANRTYLLQSDYVLPLSGKKVFETGVRSTLRTIENDFTVRESSDGNDFAILSRFNNDFEYIEDIYAAYLMFGNEIKKFSYQIGLRGEYSDIEANLKLTNDNNSWEYFNLFPSVFLSYKHKKGVDFQLSYSRRINRPSYRYLLPFQTFSDARNLWSGNPELQPEYTDSYEFGYLKYYEKGSLFSSIYYRYRTGVISRITVADAQGFTVRKPVNLATQNNIGLEINGSYKFSKKYSLNGNLNFFRAITDGSFEGQTLDNDIFTWSGRAVIKAELLPKVDFQGSFRYRAPQKSIQGERKSMYFLDLSAGKDVLKGKGTVVASIRDVFNSRRRRSIVDTETLYSESDFQWRARQFLLTFSYRINQKKKRSPRTGGDFSGGDDF